MVRFLTLLLGCLWVTYAAAEVKAGDEGVYNVQICKTQKSAVKIAEEDHLHGPVAAVKIFMEAPDCGTAMVLLQVVRAVYTNTTERGDTIRVLEVKVKLKNESWGVYYVLTDRPYDDGMI